MTMDNRKKGISSIVTYLEDQKRTGDLTEDQMITLDVAIQALEEVYGSTVRNQAAPPMHDLADLLAKLDPTGDESDLPSLVSRDLSEEDRQEAENHKTMGNDFMQAQKFTEALESYNKAIAIDNRNAAYYCNRAAAYIKLDKHQKALKDCKLSLAVDPTYSKAYGRMGIAYTSLEDHKLALDCYRRAVELEPDNENHHKNLAIAKRKLREAEADDAAKSKKPESTSSHLLKRITNLACDQRLKDIVRRWPGLMSNDAETKTSCFLKALPVLIEHMLTPASDSPASDKPPLPLVNHLIELFIPGIEAQFAKAYNNTTPE